VQGFYLFDLAMYGLTRQYYHRKQTCWTHLK